MKRYDLGGDCEGESGKCLAAMVEHKHGDYVLFDNAYDHGCEHCNYNEAEDRE